MDLMFRLPSSCLFLLVIFQPSHGENSTQFRRGVFDEHLGRLEWLWSGFFHLLPFGLPLTVFTGHLSFVFAATLAMKVAHECSISTRRFCWVHSEGFRFFAQLWQDFLLMIYCGTYRLMYRWWRGLPHTPLPRRGGNEHPARTASRRLCWVRCPQV